MNNRFDLEAAIAAWRRPLEHNRAFSDEDIEELESSLRDRVEALVAKGLSEEEAFREAVGRMGSYAMAEAEYRKVYWGKLRRRRQLPGEFTLRLAMLKNYLKIAFRTLSRYRAYAFINTAGLAAGIGCLLLLAFYVRHELSYDRFHAHADRVYRVVVDRLYDDGPVRRLAPTSPPLAPGLKGALPAVEEAVRLFNPHYTTGQVLLRHGETSHYEGRFFYADPGVFDVFSFPLLKGDPQTALREPHSVVLSETMARKYFGTDDPVGEVLVLEDSLALEVTGILRDLPATTHLKVDFLAPYALLEIQYDRRATSLWGWDLVHTYVLLRDDANPDAVRDDVQAYLDEHAAPSTIRRNYRYAAALQPLPRIHLYSDREWELEPGGSPIYPYALSAIGLFVLLIALVNFVNLSTALAARRAREVGVRKVLGGQRSQLITQFLCEAMLVSVGATVLGMLAAGLVLPIFEDLAGVPLQVHDVPLGTLTGLLLAVAVVTGLAAGSFPAFYLSSLRPVATLKGTFKARGGTLRRALVIMQFALSILLVCATGVIYEQLRYMRGKQLGFDKDHVVVLETGLQHHRFDALRTELLRHPDIRHVAATSGLPGAQVEQFHVSADESEDGLSVQMLWVDHDFVAALGLRVVAGRDFSEAYATDEAAAFLINEAAAHAFNLSEPIGKMLTWKYAGGQRQGTVVGVVEDFHTTSLHEQIAPLVLVINPSYRYLAVRVQSDDLAGVLAFLETQWKTAEPDRPFEASFLDRRFDALYASEARQARLIAAFAGLAIAIACVGLFGLAAFAAGQRRKEIGIRKVLGATVYQILVLLSKEYVRLVLAAFVLAAPVAYLAASRWLAQFAYRIDVGVGVFLGTGVAVLGLALLTVSYQSLKTALSDPVESLRYE